MDGLIKLSIVRIVDKGYTQQKGIDYKNSLSYLIYNFIRLILAIVVSMNLELSQMDLNNIYQRRTR